MRIRSWLLKQAYPVVKLISLCDLPVQRLTTPQDLQRFREKVRSGDVIVTRKRWSLAASFIPGFWSHVALALGGEDIVEAVTHGVQRSTLEHLLAGADFAMILRPQFLQVGMAERVCARALTAVGRPYDFLFEPGVKSLYCAELITFAFTDTWSGESECPWIQREVNGVSTSYPQDFASSRKFARVGQSDSLNSEDVDEYYPGAKKLVAPATQV